MTTHTITPIAHNWRSRRLRAIVARVEDMEGIRKAILMEMRPPHGIMSAEEAARAMRDYAIGEG